MQNLTQNLQLNAGTGISGWGIPVYVGLDYGVTNEITVGAELSYRHDSTTYDFGRIEIGPYGRISGEKITGFFTALALNNFIPFLLNKS